MGVSNDQRGFFKVNPVLLEILGGLLVIPLKVHSLTQYTGNPKSCQERQNLAKPFPKPARRPK